MPRFIVSLLQRLDPRQSLSIAIAWLVFGLSLTLAVVASAWVGQIVRTNLVKQYSLRLASAADHIASELDLALSLRLQSVSISAAMLSNDIRGADGKSLQRVLADVQRNFPDFVWIAAADADGQIIAATDPHVVGNNVYQYAWFSQGLIVSWIEEGVSFNDPDYLTKGKGHHFLKLTAPIRGENGGIIGVVAARLSWDWVLELVADINRGMSKVSREEWLLLDKDGIVRIGPKELVGKQWQQDPPQVSATLTDFGLGSLPPHLTLHKFDEGRDYLVAEAQQEDNESLEQLGWHVVVVQPLNQVMAAATRVQWQIAAVLLGLGLAAALLG
ncbi:MAG TPA: hypothetical protein VN028_04805, partial [Rhodocyclaceae bacterium]|nr:hypothetical protein [Rhodocyclaceae bacterium]